MEALLNFSVHFKDRQIEAADLQVIAEDWYDALIENRVQPVRFDKICSLLRQRCKFFPSIAQAIDINDELRGQTSNETGATKYVTYKDPYEDLQVERATDEERARRIALFKLSARGDMEPGHAADAQQELADKLAKEGRAGICAGPDLHYAMGAGSKSVPEDFQHIASMVDEAMKGIKHKYDEWRASQ